MRDQLMIATTATRPASAPNAIHFKRAAGPTVIDQIFEPFERFDAIMENAGGPEIIGLYAPIWQTGT